MLDRIAMFATRTVSNYFWIVVDILSHDNEKIAKRYEQSIGKEYKNECATLNVKKGHKIIHIGCGSYPLTEMTLANLFDIKITGIDKNKKAVQRAHDVVIDKKFEDKITIEQGNGAEYPVQDFDMIIVSSCALPKTEILENIFTTAKKESTIIIRDLETSTDEFLEYLSQFHDITIEKRIQHPVPFLMPIGWSAFHLKKK